MDEYIHAEQLIKKLHITRKTLWEWIRKGNIPKPARIGERTLVWKIKEIEDWIESRRMG